MFRHAHPLTLLLAIVATSVISANHDRGGAFPFDLANSGRDPQQAYEPHHPRARPMPYVRMRTAEVNQVHLRDPGDTTSKPNLFKRAMGSIKVRSSIN